MTSPDIEGNTTSKCINDALKKADMNINAIDYINLHGTGTLINDKMESTTLNRVNASNIYCSSSKTSFGHTIGAAGAMELGVCFITLSSMNKEKILPPHIYDGEYDDGLDKINLVNGKIKADRLENCMSVSFGFGTAEHRFEGALYIPNDLSNLLLQYTCGAIDGRRRQQLGLQRAKR